MLPVRAVLTSVLLATLVTRAAAVPVVGKLELPPPPDRPVPVVHGWVDRVENPKKPIQPFNVGPYLLVVLENDTTRPDSGGQVKWELVGDSFAWPVIGAPTGAQVVIKNLSSTARTLVALEDPKLMQTGLINPKTGERSFTSTEPRVYTITDMDAPHLVGRVVVVPTSYIAHVEVSGTTGKFELGDVTEGSYKLRIYYKDHWLPTTETVTVPAKLGKGSKSHDITVKVSSYQAAEKAK